MIKFLYFEIMSILFENDELQDESDADGGPETTFPLALKPPPCPELHIAKP